MTASDSSHSITITITAFDFGALEKIHDIKQNVNPYDVVVFFIDTIVSEEIALRYYLHSQNMPSLLINFLWNIACIFSWMLHVSIRSFYFTDYSRWWDELRLQKCARLQVSVGVKLERVRERSIIMKFNYDWCTLLSNLSYYRWQLRRYISK